MKKIKKLENEINYFKKNNNKSQAQSQSQTQDFNSEKKIKKKNSIKRMKINKIQIKKKLLNQRI